MIGAETRIAVAELLAADTVTATATTGSTTSQVALASGAASFAVGDWVNLTGTGATAANHRRRVQVTGVDASLQTVDFYPALSIAPASGDVVRKGWREWARVPVASLDQWVYTGPLYGEHPAMALLREETAPPVVGILVPQDDERITCELGEHPVRLRVLGTFLEWVEGAVARAEQLLDGRRSDLTMRASTCYHLVTGTVTKPQREDALIEQVIPIAPQMAPAFA